VRDAEFSDPRLIDVYDAEATMSWSSWRGADLYLVRCAVFEPTDQLVAQTREW